MKRVLDDNFYPYEKRDKLLCKCQEEISVIQKPKVPKRSEGRPFRYYEDYVSKTFQLKYEKPLSSVAKCLLNSFQKKYLYYAIDDILYLLKSNITERDNLLAILYSPVLSLQNNLSINFLDIWVQEIYITEVSKPNRFLTNDCSNFEPFSYITIKLGYKTKQPIKKKESLW